MPDIRDLILDLPIKEMDGTLLAAYIRERSLLLYGQGDRDRINQALNLASFLHRKQTRSNRGNLPRDLYITHPLRNTVRLMRYGLVEVDILIASILHDTIEDCATEIVTLLVGIKSVPSTDRKTALLYLEGEFGFRVAHIVKLVSNPESYEYLTKDQKRQRYIEHVIHVINLRPDVFLVKLSDWVDNAVGLRHNNVEGNEGMILHLSAKYLPLADAFDKAFTDEVRSFLSEGGAKELVRHIQSGRDSLTKMREALK